MWVSQGLTTGTSPTCVYKEWKATAYVRQTHRRKRLLTRCTSQPHILKAHVWKWQWWRWQQKDRTSPGDINPFQVASLCCVRDGECCCRCFCFRRSAKLASAFDVLNEPVCRHGFPLNQRNVGIMSRLHFVSLPNLYLTKFIYLHFYIYILFYWIVLQFEFWAVCFLGPNRTVGRTVGALVVIIVYWENVAEKKPFLLGIAQIAPPPA